MKIGDIIEVIWIDAVGDSKWKKEDIEKYKIESILCETKTYGKLAKKDDSGILIYTVESKLHVDYMAIPINMIKKINIMKVTSCQKKRR